MKQYKVIFNLSIQIVLIFVFTSCEKENTVEVINKCSNEGILETFISSEDQKVAIYENGNLYIEENDICNFALQYFDPNFINENYLSDNLGTYLITDNEGILPIKNNFTETFESYSSFPNLFIKSITDTNLYWSSFTLQSPKAPNIANYVELGHCIINETCSFLDNKIELVNDPTNSSNKVLKFTSVAPSQQMVTSKSSISSFLNYYSKNSEVWFQASYYIESGMPYSIADFENSYFENSPGPRIVIRDNKLVIENKFGSKLNFNSDSNITIPLNTWFTIKFHLKYSNKNDGIIELWQNDNLIISTTGINLPTSNSIQNILEVGITANSEACTLFFDNMMISQTPL